MISQGVFIDRESLTPAEWDKFSKIALAQGTSEKDLILDLILKRIHQDEEPPAIDMIRRAMAVFAQIKQ